MLDGFLLSKTCIIVVCTYYCAMEHVWRGADNSGVSPLLPPLRRFQGLNSGPRPAQQVPLPVKSSLARSLLFKITLASNWALFF